MFPQYYTGLPLGEAKRLNYYFHFRSTPTYNDDSHKTITDAVDFLTPIDKDIPKGKSLSLITRCASLRM